MNKKLIKTVQYGKTTAERKKAINKLAKINSTKAVNILIQTARLNYVEYSAPVCLGNFF